MEDFAKDLADDFTDEFDDASMSIDIGSMWNTSFNSIFNSKGTVECGSRPTCLGWSEGCKQKQAAYYECTKAASGARGSAAKAKATTGWVILGIIVIVMILLVVMTTKRK